MKKDAAEKHGDLLARLYRKTRDGSLKWELNAGRDPTVNLLNYKVVLQSGSGAGNPIEYLTVQTSYDEHIETVSDEDLTYAISGPTKAGFSSFYDLMCALREDAFRQAVGADKALDDLLGELDDEL